MQISVVDGRREAMRRVDVSGVLSPSVGLTATATMYGLNFTLTTTTGDHLLPAKKISWAFFLLWAHLTWAKLVLLLATSVLSKSILSANR